MLELSKCAKVSDDDPPTGTDSCHVAMVVWFSIVATVFVVWGATLYNVLVEDWVRGAVAACAVCLSVVASILARMVVRWIA
jgi:hypothetical protein